MRRPSRALAALLGGVVGLGVVIAIIPGLHLPETTRTWQAVTAPIPSEDPAPAPTAVPVSPPARLQIPRLGVDTAIETVTTWPDGEMGIPKDPHNVGWYQGSVVPGSPGNAIINGHVEDWVIGPAVFYNLRQLVVGDEIDIVTDSGQKIRFRMTGSETYGYNDRTPAAWYTRSGSATLALYTCDGYFDLKKMHYNSRYAVRAVEITT